MHHFYKIIFTLHLLFFLNAAAYAQEFNDHQDFSRYSVYYSIFNSTFISADTAKIYGIKRSKYENLINVSLSPKGQYGALPAKISGTVRNLMQQQKILDFIEIKEQGATYYIAPIRLTAQEILHFDLQVTPEGESNTLNIKFHRKLYPDP